MNTEQFKKRIESLENVHMSEAEKSRVLNHVLSLPVRRSTSVYNKIRRAFFYAIWIPIRTTLVAVAVFLIFWGSLVAFLWNFFVQGVELVTNL